MNQAMTETYLSRDFRKTAAKRFPAQADELNAAFDARLQVLWQENAGTSREKKERLKRQILPDIAAYETLQTVMPKEEALQTVRLCRAAGEHDAQVPCRRAARPGAVSARSRRFCQIDAELLRACGGFAAEELQTGNGIWRVDMTRYPYHNTGVEYGCPELCRCFCDSDDISYGGLHPKLIWQRTMTLGRGDDCCDFCMKVKK